MEACQKSIDLIQDAPLGKLDVERLWSPLKFYIPESLDIYCEGGFNGIPLETKKIVFSLLLRVTNFPH